MSIFTVSNTFQMTQLPALTQKLQRQQSQYNTRYIKSKQRSSKDKYQLNQSANIKKRRRLQPLYLYILVILCQLFTTYSILILAFVQDNTIAYAIYIAMTIFRCSVWLFNSWKLIGFSLPMARLYFLLDSILLLQISADAAYIGLNYQDTSGLAVWAISIFPFLYFFLAGNFRVMLVYCDWKPWQILVYKLIRFQAALFYLIYGVYASITKEIENVQLFLLFIFSTFGFYCEILGAFNSLDQSGNLFVHLNLKDEECKNLQLDRFQEKTGETQY